MLPPGRVILVAKPAATGSPVPNDITTGIVVDALLAASIEISETAMIASMLPATSARASSDICDAAPTRTSRTRFWPSTKPALASSLVWHPFAADDAESGPSSFRPRAGWRQPRWTMMSCEHAWIVPQKSCAAFPEVRDIAARFGSLHQGATSFPTHAGPYAAGSRRQTSPYVGDTRAKERAVTSRPWTGSPHSRRGVIGSVVMSTRPAFASVART